MPPGIRFEQLPPIDFVLLSHDHYDHLDSGTVQRIVSAHPRARWIVPLGVAPFIMKKGAKTVEEFDWWEEREIYAGVELGCVPAQHFSGRGVRRNQTLWCGWNVAGGGRRVYFVGDTGRHPAFSAIGKRFGPFDAVLMPIGAYDPRWFMAPVHLDPEEAIESFLELTAKSKPTCPMVPMHWGTFKLTDEPMSEPPELVKVIWQRHGLDPDRLWLMGNGETRWLP
jgi:N-acyl-phosphatidylethanolamine-hydrolysing phospholipase D